MKVQADRSSDVQVITGYGPGWLAVDKVQHQGSVLIASSGLLQAWDCPNFSALTAEHFSALAHLCQGVEVLLLGTGPTQRFIHPRWWAPLHAQGIGTETMSTPAALRTYNVLAMEGRNVLAALVLE